MIFTPKLKNKVAYTLHKSRRFLYGDSSWNKHANPLLVVNHHGLQGAFWTRRLKTDVEPE